jgi:ribose transport system substrate-binding protein
MPRGFARYAAVALAAASMLAACGDDDSSDGGGNGGGSGSKDLAELQAKIDRYREVPKFKAPGPAFDARKAAQGKSLMNIPASSAIPFVQTIGEGIGRIAGDVGMRFVDWPNQGRPVQWVQGMNAAVDRKVNGINLLAGINPEALEPQIRAAKAAGITTIVSHLYDVGQTPAPNVETVDIHYKTAGELLADWVILKTEAKADVLVITINEVVSTKPMVEGIRGEFNRYCPDDCNLSFINVAIPDVATRIQPQVQSALVENPNIKYIIALYDSAEAPFAAAGVKAAGAGDRVKIVTFNGTPSVLKMVQDEDVVEMDIGENLDWISHGVMDQTMRIMGGLDPVEDPNIPLRIFDKENVDESGVPPKVNEGFGDAYVSGYRELWKLGN